MLAGSDRLSHPMSVVRQRDVPQRYVLEAPKKTSTTYEMLAHRDGSVLIHLKRGIWQPKRCRP